MEKSSVGSSRLLPSHHQNLGGFSSGCGWGLGSRHSRAHLGGLQSTGSILPIQGSSNPCLLYLSWTLSPSFGEPRRINNNLHFTPWSLGTCPLYCSPVQQLIGSQYTSSVSEQMNESGNKYIDLAEISPEGLTQGSQTKETWLFVQARETELPNKIWNYAMFGTQCILKIVRCLSGAQI